ncbi:sigma 54-interacting transcriptional regulator, partial [Escherichia coli]|uniref:sigma 54-interacting transcriptional regulator n=5 Tax=Gammaproteobacteria TaxID=1236 RepID=UPI00390C583A
GKPGLFEAAHRGTLFLDEIGDMPVSLQTRLLRVLQEREVLRLGGTEPISIDVRIIAATHKDLGAAMKDREFRTDLYYRLNILRLQTTPLR